MITHRAWEVRHRRASHGVALVLALIAIGAGLALPSTALGHAGALGSSPANGERLTVAPAVLTIDFTEPVGIGAGAVRLVDAAGAGISLDSPTRDGNRVTQALPPLRDGWYLATWSVVSADGHIVHGAAAFAVGNAEGPPLVTPVDAPAVAATALARALGDGGVLVAVGGIGAALLLAAATRRVRHLVLGAALLGVAGGLALAALIVVDAGPAAFSAPSVAASLARAALLSAIAAAVVAGRWRVAAVPGAIALGLMAVGGHPAGHPVTATLFLLHLGGGALWLGAAPAVLVVLRDPSVSDPDAHRTVRRFSMAATATLVLAVGGGSILALLLTNAFATGVDARYVVLLAAKASLVGLAALLGAITRHRLPPGSVTRRDLRRLFAVDAVVFVVVIVLSAGLAAGAPSEVHEGDGDVHVGHCSLDLADRVAGLSVAPAIVGGNTIYLDGAGDLEHGTVELRRVGDPAPITFELEPHGAGWTATGAIPVAGTWDALVAIGRDAFTEERVACQLRILP